MFENSIKDLAYAQEIADLEQELEQVKKENDQLLKLFQETNKQRRNLRRLSKSQSIAYDNIYIDLNNTLLRITEVQDTDRLYNMVKELRDKYSMKEEYLFSR